MKNFIHDDSAVSPILGFILVLSICISILTYMQVYSVPVWNTEIEFEHMDTVYDDMLEMASEIEDVAVSGVPKSCVIQLGIEYPVRAVFHNPRPGIAGTLSVVSANNITINYTNATGTHMKTYPSCSIRYTAFGTAVNPAVVYEHGIVIRDHGKYGNSTTCEQTLISGDNINLVIINGSYSASSMESGRLSVYYNNSGSETVSGNITQVNITMTTGYPDIWVYLLEGTNTTNTTVSLSDNKIMINSTAVEEISLPEMKSTFSGIYAGVAKFSTEIISQINVTQINVTNITQIIQSGTQIDLGSDYPRIAAPCINSAGDQPQENCGKIKKQATYVNVTATIYNAPSKDEVYADLTMLANCSEYESYPVYAWTLNMNSSDGNITTSIYPSNAFDTFPNNFTATWTVRDMDDDKNVFNGLEDKQLTFTTLWVTNSTDNQQYVTYALAVIK